jgi:serine/threonine protein kinase
MNGAPQAGAPGAIGRYRIREELGRGMMGVVYLAEDPALDRLIALKTIDLAFTVPDVERAAFEQRFLAEARVAARLSHPGIVVVHDVGRDDARGMLYIALEYLPGQTLSEVVSGGRAMDWREALRVVAEVARALHHAHTHGVVHRDVKPANIMLMATGQAKIMDFGIAKVPNMELTSAGQFFGTPLYMSPEQATGAPLDGRSDLFSLGAVAYQLLTGRLAFKGDNVPLVLARVVHEDPRPASHVVPELPADVDRVLARAMAKDPARRYATGGDLAADIEDVLAGRPLRGADELATLDLDEPLATVLDEAPSTGRRPAGEATTRSPRAAPAPSPPRAEAPAAQPLRSATPRWQPSSPRPFWRRRSTWAFAVGAVALLALGAALRGPSAPAPRGAGRPSSSVVPASEPRRERPTPAPEPERTPAAQPEPLPAEGEGLLAIDFEHHLRSGRIQVWVDEDEVLDEALDSRVARKILSLRLRKGAVQDVLPVSAGKHDVRVRVAWSDKVRTRRISGVFTDGQTRRLEVRVSRIFNELSLKWQ